MAELSLRFRELPPGLRPLVLRRKKVEKDLPFGSKSVDGVLYEEQDLARPLKLFGDVREVLHRAADAVEAVGDEAVRSTVQKFLLDPLERGPALQSGPLPPSSKVMPRRAL